MRTAIAEKTRWEGVCALAKAVGVSHGHLSQVLHGRRECSRRLAAKLRRRGVEVAGGGARPVGIGRTCEAGRKAMAAEEGGAE